MIVPISVQSLNVPRQMVLTADDVTVDIDAVVFIRVVDVTKAAFAVHNYAASVVDLAATTLAALVGETSSEVLFQSRDTLNERISEAIQPQTDEWGIDIIGLELSQVQIPDKMKRVLAAAAEARREAEAKFITAEGELRAAKTLAKAAKMLQDPGAMQLRYYQTLTELGGENNTSTVIVQSGIPQMEAVMAGAAASASNSKRKK